MLLDWSVDKKMNNIIYSVLSLINRPVQGFVFKRVNNILWGKDEFDNVTFGLISNDNTKSIIQSTKSLSLLLNVECNIEENEMVKVEKLNILVLKDIQFIDTFINLSEVYIQKNDNKSLLEFFMQLRELFSNSNKTDRNELQGLFGELYTLYYFKVYLNVDLSNFYQSINKMKFDYSVSNTKKIEVKTTLKEERIHHFTNEQLNSLRYDIMIISILLLKDDKGISLYDLIIRSKNMFPLSFNLLLNLEKIIIGNEINDLKSISFNEKYLLDNIRIYDSIQVPRLTEKTNEGIFNIEYDSNLSNTVYLDREKILFWFDQLITS